MGDPQCSHESIGAEKNPHHRHSTTSAISCTFRTAIPASSPPPSPGHITTYIARSRGFVAVRRESLTGEVPAAAVHGANPRDPPPLGQGQGIDPHPSPAAGRESTPTTAAPAEVDTLEIVGPPTSLAETVAAQAERDKLEERAVPLVAEQRAAELEQEQVARWARGWPTDRERRALEHVQHLERLSKAAIRHRRGDRLAD
jgi:hypothetical protein